MTLFAILSPMIIMLILAIGSFWLWWKHLMPLLVALGVPPHRAQQRRIVFRGVTHCPAELRSELRFVRMSYAAVYAVFLLLSALVFGAGAAMFFLTLMAATAILSSPLDTEELEA